MLYLITMVVLSVLSLVALISSVVAYRVAGKRGVYDRFKEGFAIAISSLFLVCLLFGGILGGLSSQYNYAITNPALEKELEVAIENQIGLLDAMIDLEIRSAEGALSLSDEALIESAGLEGIRIKNKIANLYERLAELRVALHQQEHSAWYLFKPRYDLVGGL